MSFSPAATHQASQPRDKNAGMASWGHKTWSTGEAQHRKLEKPKKEEFRKSQLLSRASMMLGLTDTSMALAASASMPALIPQSRRTSWGKSAQQPQQQTLQQPRKRSPKVEGEHQLCTCIYRVLLARPSVKAPWGVQWVLEQYDTAGCREVAGIDRGSPMARWNLWQTVCGRPELACQVGDRLIRVDGRWAFCDQEVSKKDGDMAATIFEQNAPPEEVQATVWELSRLTVRPIRPDPPRVLAYELTATLGVVWASKTWAPREEAWSICIQDTRALSWFVVDGADFNAKPLSRLRAVASIHPSVREVEVTGLTPGRSYAACVAVKTEKGWSSYSELSWTAVVGANLPVEKLPLLEDKDAIGPFYVTPQEVIPGASTPVPLEDGPRDLFSQPRQVRLKLVYKGSLAGLEFFPSMDGHALVLREIVAGSLAHKDIEAQLASKSVVALHGAVIAKALQVGDCIVRLNGLLGAPAMKAEIARKPQVLTMTILRNVVGGPRGNLVHLAPVTTRAERSFEVNLSLDGEASRLAEEVQWSVLLQPDEADFVQRLLEHDVRNLEEAMAEVVMRTRAVPRQGLQRDELLLETLYPGIMRAAETRLFVLRRQQEAKVLGQATPGSQGSSRSGNRTLQQHQQHLQEAADERAIMQLQKAMADVAADPDRMVETIEAMSQTSYAMRSSATSKKLIERAKTLQVLWRWRRRKELARLGLQKALQGVLAQEAESVARSSASEPDTFPPDDGGRLQRATEMASEFRDDLEFELQEAAEVQQRLQGIMERRQARLEVEHAATDFAENKEALTVALQEAKTKQVDYRTVLAAEVVLRNWQDRHSVLFWCDQVSVLIADLNRHISKADEPGVGGSEHQHLREMLESPPRVHSDAVHFTLEECKTLEAQIEAVCMEAQKTLFAWQAKNLALRTEARLMNAMRRCAVGYSIFEPDAGDRLGNALAEAAGAGASVGLQDEARTTLTKWINARKMAATKDLEKAAEYRDAGHLQKALAMAKVAGVDEDKINEAEILARHLQHREDVDKLLEAAMEDAFQDHLLEQAIQRGHEILMLEEESAMLLSGVLQCHLRYWTAEFHVVAKDKESSNIRGAVQIVEDLLKRCEQALQVTLKVEGVPDVAVRSLKREVNSLMLVLPDVRDMAAVSGAEAELKRVLGSVERSAHELPEVIEAAEAQVAKGLNVSLLQMAKLHLQAQKAIVEELQDAIQGGHDLSGPHLKALFLKARVEGAPSELVQKACGQLETRHPELWRAAQAELDLLIALRKADDISDLSVEHRFLRLQDAAEAVTRTGVQLDPQLSQQVQKASLALAAEQTLSVKVAEALQLLEGRPARSDRVRAQGEELRKACMVAREAALTEVQKSLPSAWSVRDRLQAEADRRELAEEKLAEVMRTRDIMAVDLRNTIFTAREAGMPLEGELEAAYSKLHRLRREALQAAVQAAQQAGGGPQLHALAYRGLCLAVGHEEVNTVSFEEILRTRSRPDWAEIITLTSSFTGLRNGGGFGSQTWRSNPQFALRWNSMAIESAANNPHLRNKHKIQVSAAVAVASPMPATFSLHIVQNSNEAAAAGCRWLLAPGFKVLASSKMNEDLAYCNFDLPYTTDDNPIFIVPSTPKGEQVPFKLIVQASEPVEVNEVSDDVLGLWAHAVAYDVEWSTSQPHIWNMGGPLRDGTPPPLSWYRNPQFRVCLKEQHPPKSAESLQASSSVFFETPTHSLHPQLFRLDSVVSAVSSVLPAVGEVPSTVSTFRRGVSHDSQAKAQPEQPSTTALEEGRGRTPKGTRPDLESEEEDAMVSRVTNPRRSEPALRTLEESPTLPLSPITAPPSPRPGPHQAHRRPMALADLDEDGATHFSHPTPSGRRDSDMSAATKISQLVKTKSHARSMAERIRTRRPDKPMLLAVLKPAEGASPEAPVAVHIMANKLHSNPKEDVRLAENPRHHTMVARSGCEEAEYQAVNEVAAACVLQRDEHAQGLPVYIIPSLESKELEGKFTLTLLTTAETLVERVR